MRKEERGMRNEELGMRNKEGGECYGVSDDG